MGRWKVGSIGLAVPNAELSLIDSEGNLIEEANTEGEMCYRGKNVTLGYARKREDLLLGDERNGFIVPVIWLIVMRMDVITL